MKTFNQRKDYEYHIETSRQYSDKELTESMFAEKVMSVLRVWSDAGWEKAVDSNTGETIEPDIDGNQINVYLQREKEKTSGYGRGL